MTNPLQLTNPSGSTTSSTRIKKVHPDALEQLSRRRHRRRPPRRRRRPPHRPLRRPGPPLRRLLDRHRPQHGRHQAGRPEALRPQGRREPRPRSRARASAASPPAPGTSWWPRTNEAHAAGNAEITPAHLVLGLLAEPDGLAAKAIARTGRPPGRRPRRPRPPPCRPPPRSRPTLIPYDAAAKKVLELTFREALRLGHNYVGTEHILLALLEHENGSGPLSSTGLTKETSERLVVEALAAFTDVQSGQ